MVYTRDANAEPEDRVLHSTRAFVALLITAFIAISIAAPGTAHGDSVRVIRARFATSIENSEPVGAQNELGPDGAATYFLVVANPGAATSVTLIWKHDGREVLRQSLDIGHAPRWRTWATHRVRRAHTVEVTVLDADGTPLRADTLQVH